MRHYLQLGVTVALITAVMGCQSKTSEQGMDAPFAQAGFAEAPEQGQSYTGTVVETMNSGGYTYVQVDTGSEKVWAASTEFQVTVGDQVTVPPGTPMHNYRSRTLEREFETIYFVQSVALAGAAGPAGRLAPEEMPAGHPQVSPGSVGEAVDFTGIQVPSGGTTIAELFANKGTLAGQEVVVRGKVVKVSSGIMGKNWIHLRDGTGSSGTNDLTVTTQAMAKVGDTVVARGVLVADKDFGYGYKYEVIIEDGKIAAE